MKHKVDLSLIKQNSKDEEIIKEWKVNQHISTKNESSNVESTITLTKKRLILSEKTNSLCRFCQNKKKNFPIKRKRPPRWRSFVCEETILPCE